uniref:Serpin domain-containing protein n=1 Tax=Timema cristinae TaxID=61476 RepID=A0A7R9GTX9_TIMCR|nr:unnamed protein product [Timema cristinae]
MVLQVFREDASSNTITSPLSLEVVLGMIVQGAKGTTKTQLQQSLYLPKDDDVAKTGFRELLAPLKSNENITLDLANAAFLALDFQLESIFQKVASDDFKASTTNVDFAGDTSGSVDAVNKWVEDHTHGKITNLVPASLNPSTKLVLVNAVYFKGLWDVKFNSSLTKKAPFYVDGKTTLETDLMNVYSKFGYAESDELGAKLLELKYKGGDARLVIILPDDKDGLDDLESKLTNMNQVAITDERFVNVTIPKFKIEQTIKYTEILKKLGITQVFSSLADLSGMSVTDNLYLDEVIQKSYIEVNEEGSEAASSTETDVPSSVFEHPVDFVADHPFLFVLQDVKTNAVIFFGQYLTPD